MGYIDWWALDERRVQEGRGREKMDNLDTMRSAMTTGACLAWVDYDGSRICVSWKSWADPDSPARVKQSVNLTPPTPPPFQVEHYIGFGATEEEAYAAAEQKRIDVQGAGSAT